MCVWGPRVLGFLSPLSLDRMHCPDRPTFWSASGKTSEDCEKAWIHADYRRCSGVIISLLYFVLGKAYGNPDSGRSACPVRTGTERQRSAGVQNGNTECSNFFRRVRTAVIQFTENIGTSTMWEISGVQGAALRVEIAGNVAKGIPTFW